ncbi:MAG: HDIG domain-containing protein [Prevotella sp.]|nr:HDIG domain-containing protein [Prevotella sp.]
MININFKTDFTWRDIAWRIALVAATVAIIVWFMPRDNRMNFKVEAGKVWRYNDLTSNFDFPVYKSDSTIQREQAEALRQYEPYYVYHDETAEQQEQLLDSQIQKQLPTMGRQFVNVVKTQLRSLYQQGIIDTREPLTSNGDTALMLRRIDDKEATSISASSVYTARQAYKVLMAAPALSEYADQLAKLNLNDFLVPNLIYDHERSQSNLSELKRSVPKASGVVQRGQKIVNQGEVVTQEKFLIIDSYRKELEKRYDQNPGISTTLGGELLYVFIIISMFTAYLHISRKNYFDNLRSIAMIYSLVVLACITASLLVSHNLLHIFILPFAIVPIFIRVFMDSRTAFMAHVTVILICACQLQRPLEFTAVELVAGMAAILSLRELSSRSQLFFTAAVTTIAAILTNVAIFLIRSGNISLMDRSELYYLIICGIIIFCSYPLLYLIEKGFGFVSPITLIELSDMNKELLRRMSEVAPGTFQHSIQVGNLAAEIARKIGADPLLLRTGALYHDIGKISNPIYYTENQSGGISPHQQLSCIESAQMIISHVTEGLKLADKHNLPQQISELITTHHGQGKAKYFYIKYKNEHPDEPVDDLLFTYPGPNPFTKEQAILMMADAVEAASRSLPDYTEQTIRELVNRIIDSQLKDGFFRECPITFRDVQYAKTILIEKLKTIYHTRISYPEEKK